MRLLHREHLPGLFRDLATKMIFGISDKEFGFDDSLVIQIGFEAPPHTGIAPRRNKCNHPSSFKVPKSPRQDNFDGLWTVALVRIFQKTRPVFFVGEGIGSQSFIPPPAFLDLAPPDNNRTAARPVVQRRKCSNIVFLVVKMAQLHLLTVWESRGLYDLCGVLAHLTTVMRGGSVGRWRRVVSTPKEGQTLAIAHISSL
jgi:hypothetical protein